MRELEKAKVGRLAAMVFGAGCLALLGHSCFIDEGPELVPAVASEPVHAAPVEPPGTALPEPSPLPETIALVPELTPADVARLAEDVADADAGRRASAIDALAAAPEADALPVLQKVLGGGGDVDRQLALSSLHALALRQGDAGGAIRELLRQAIYDGGDEAVASGAQVALEDIERDTNSPEISR